METPARTRTVDVEEEVVVVLGVSKAKDLAIPDPDHSTD
jgi:hypothetical protein